MGSQALTDQQLLDALRAGVARSRNLMALITDFHGGPLTTEYILTADIARELIDRHCETAVEFANRKLINGLTARKGVNARKVMGSRRTDVVVLNNSLVPAALIEVKIGVRSLGKIKGDLKKLTSTIALLKSRYAARVAAAVVYQVHVPGTDKIEWRDQLLPAIQTIEKRLEQELEAYRLTDPGYSFDIHPLQSLHEGITERAIEDDGHEKTLGAHGHATRFYAVLVRSKQVAPPAARTIAELKAQSDE
ncbi:hypothetical protein [Sinorhizobium meliloti]|nr:hypothetical protein U8C39_09535 [Sinorhizobium meliloti]WQP31698.1 hypothetical protein U8C45_09500 [Sinorhizobium meliloti]